MFSTGSWKGWVSPDPPQQLAPLCSVGVSDEFEGKYENWAPTE